MRNPIKITIATAMMLLLTSCASHENFVQKYNSWVGTNVAYLVSDIGYPDSTYTLPNRHKVYVYERSRVYTTPSISPMFGYGFGGGYYGGYYGGMSYGSEVVQETCKLFFETNRKNIIVKWGSRGNHCVSK